MFSLLENVTIRGKDVVQSCCWIKVIERSAKPSTGSRGYVNCPRIAFQWTGNSRDATGPVETAPVTPQPLVIASFPFSPTLDQHWSFIDCHFLQLLCIIHAPH